MKFNVKMSIKLKEYPIEIEADSMEAALAIARAKSPWDLFGNVTNLFRRLSKATWSTDVREVVQQGK